MGIRPEQLVVGRGGTPARAITVEHLGAETVVLLETAAGEVHVLLGAADRLMPGEQTTVRAVPGSPLFFDEAGALLPAGNGAAMAAQKESAYGT
jgi:ABC-type sugar transport system ATPase subunit